VNDIPTAEGFTLEVESSVGTPGMSEQLQSLDVSAVDGTYWGSRTPDNLFDHNYGYEIWQGATNGQGSDWVTIDIGSDP
jgi:hypothetical protein